MSPSRGRAASLSHAPQSSSVPLSPGQAVGRKSLDTGPSKLSSLMRSVVTRRARSVTWQPSHEQDDEEKTKESPKHTGVNNTSPETEVYLRRAVSLEKCAVNPELQILPHKWGLRRTLSAKVRAHYHRYAQLSETAVILSTRAVVRRERVSFTAFAEKYNEATCQRFRQSVQEWSEMWLALTKRGILFYLSSKKRPTVQVLFPPYVSIAPRVSLFSTLDMSLSITYSSRRRAEAFIADAKGKRALDSVASKDSEAVKSNLRVVIIKFPSSQVAFEWYREIGQTLLFERLMYPQCFLGPVPPAAQAPPVSVLVNVPEMGVKVQVKLGRHNAAIPNNVLLGGADDGLLEQQWRCESTTVWHVRRDVVNLLLGDKVIGPQMQQWLDAERDGLLSVGMAWRRFDRLDWVMPCGALGPTGNFILNGINEMVIGPQLLEGTHTLELRVLEHYPDSVVIGGASVPEPLGFEGFVLLKRDKKRRTEIVSYRPMLLTSYDNWLFLIPAPRAARHVDVSANACDAPTRYSGSLTHGSPKSNNGGSNGQIVCYYHANVHTGSKQMSLAKYMLNITEVDQIVPILHDSDSIADDDRHRSESRASADTESMSLRSDYTTGAGSDHGTHRDKVKGKLLGFLRSKKNRQMSCKFKLVTRAGATVVLWAASEQCMHEWVRRLTELRYYWINRLLSDLTLRSQVGVLNYALQGRRSREKDMPDWNDEKAWADRAIWHACLNLGCRDIIISGTLYRKRRRHQGMRRVFCILTHGRLIEYKFPQAPHAPIQSALADQIVRRDVRMSQLFDGARNGGAPVIAAMSDVSSEAAGSIANNSEARLLFTKSRSLSLRQCYVVSRFIDDLNTHDIMCEPWVMTDIGNYSGLRLADRVYADGIVSHELINDCVFTVWRPTFVPAILRTGKASEIRVVPDDALCDASELSSDEYNTGSASESRADSPKVGGVDVKRSVSFSPLVDEPRSALSDSHAMQPLPTQPRDPGHHHHHSHLHRHRHSFDTPRLLVGGQAKPTSVNRTSGDVPRLSGEGYLSSTSNASSNISSGRPQDHGRPGAYRVGNEIHVSVDDRHEGTKRMNAMTMVSSMRHRVGVYKARTSAEMEQWVTAINQEIRRIHIFYPDHEHAAATWPADQELALLILNQPIPHADKSLFRELWARAKHRICVDGGGNRLYELGIKAGALEAYVPDAIVGDLDSLLEQPRAYYKQRGAEICYYSDQDSTDFMKGLRYLDDFRRAGRSTSSCAVVVLGGLCGRVDHILHSLKVLFNTHLERQMLIVSEENLTFVLPKGANRILINRKVDGPTCGILPLAGETVLTTNGLRWNLDHHLSTFEGLMSTSNIIDGAEVYIESTLPVAWTSELRPLP
ncbi:thiamine pyrophosphokinase [Coemansia thaxteri]|nr:thiamine pyrophosphokinase [Coemansia thaxteri]